MAGRVRRLTSAVCVCVCAGCNLLSASGVSGLSQLTNLQELELTNCPCILTSDVCRFLRDRLPRCVVLD